jgi:cysteine desulfurase
MKVIDSVYLDNNATTAVAPEVMAAMAPYFTLKFANPSSLHAPGIIAEQAIKAARHVLAKQFNANDEEILFTGGGTESINLGIKGVAQALKRQGKHIITVETEHEAVLASVNQLVQAGFTVSFAKVDRYGQVSADAVQALLTDETILVAIMHVNNELGTINPIAAIARAVKARNKNIRVFVDGVQAFGKLNVAMVDVDLYAISGHKLHAPKGVGALYVKQGTPLQPLLSGGGQEFGLRSGTENVPGIVGLVTATELAYQQLSKNIDHLCALKLYFVEQLQTLPNVIINSPLDGLPNTINVSFIGMPAEVMMHSLNAKGVYVSAGSACSGAQRKPSRVLRAAGLPTKQIQSAIRFSFSRYQTRDEIDFTLTAINEALQSSVHEKISFLHMT